MHHNSKADQHRWWDKWMRSGAIQNEYDLMFRSGTTPKDYRCDTCGETGVKLWREHSFSFPMALLCGPCACKAAGKKDTIDEQGRREGELGSKTDQIGWWLPAVPAGKDAYWSYTAVPMTAANWWRKLPTRKTPSPEAFEAAA